MARLPTNFRPGLDALEKLDPGDPGSIDSCDRFTNACCDRSKINQNWDLKWAYS